jgi:recombination protein RecT
MTDKPLAKRKPNELRELIEGSEFRAQLAKALPNAMSPERFVRITVTSTMRNPRLLQCSRQTFFRCLLDLSAIGLEPDGRQAYLIPRKNKKTGEIDCTLIIGYQGIKELLYRNGDIIDEHSDVVGDMDHFEYEFGSQKHLIHRPNVHSRGRIFAAYSYISLPRGGQTFQVMGIEEIEAVRKRSASPEEGPWISDWSEMAKKTVFRRLAKGLPLSPKTRDALELDQADDLAQPVSPTRAMIGGKAIQAMPDEDPGLAFEEPLEPQSDDDEPVSPPEASQKPPGPLTRLKWALKEAGFKPDELVALLKLPSVHLITDDRINRIDLVPRRALEQCLDDWDNCVLKLKEQRELAKQPQEEEFPA